MQIGLCLPHFGRPLEPGRLLQVAQRAEARGLDSLWVTDHVIVPKDVYIAYREEMLDLLAEALRGFAALGVSHVALDVSLTTYPAILETIDVLAREVRPALGD